ncbi:MAG: Ni/Fe hydrogenase subunit alpha [Nitrospirota bacterium]|nr:Ni/Fe hydrogenase subunit alpha [Nitrospirota bacterium]
MPGNPDSTRTIKIDMMARVEGEGALHVTVKDGQVQDVQLRIFEPPRFFEAFLQGRHVNEVPDIVARICGICPVAYQMSAVHALEPIFGVEIPQGIRDLRRLLYCGEWIESHVLHIYLLQSPDFLGFASGLDMARSHSDLVKRGLRMKKAGNHLLTLLGGRSVHPVSVKIGGFSQAPTKSALHALKDEFLWARDAAVETLRWVSRFEFQDPEQTYTFLALRGSSDYPMNEGDVMTNQGHHMAASEFEHHFHEVQVPYSNALHCTLNGRSYLTGPLARLALNQDRLSALAKEFLQSTGLALPFNRASMGIVARSVEVLYAFDEALRLIENYEPPCTPAVPVTFRAGVGMAATEAPRGLLYHRYEVNTDGTIRLAKIVPPTSQNQRRMEDDLRNLLPGILHLNDQETARKCEQLIRSYDPCISCATHFLKFTREEVS